jgi:regulation of enolase protein 1 (concanavalin A-like superfamily)
MIRKNVIYSSVILLLVVTGPIVFAQDNQKLNSTSMKAQPIPLSSFKHCDVGNPAITGTVKVSENGINITAGGADVWGVKDEFNFVYVERTGDFDLASRIENLSAANLYTKAGLMAREDLTAGCRHIYFQVFPDNNPRNNNNGGYEFQYRQMKDSEMKAIYPKSATGTPEFPVAYPNTWIRLQRIKNDFTGYFSADGKTWKVYTTFNLDLPSKIYLGLAVTSHNVKETTAARFSSISENKN